MDGIPFWAFISAFSVLEIVVVFALCVWRCQADDSLNCSSYKGLSVSYIIDYDNFVYRGLVTSFLAMAAGINFILAFYLIFPDYKHPIFMFFRSMHCMAYLGIFFVGIFPVGSYNHQHMGSAFALFVFFSIEFIGVLFIPCNKFTLWGCSADKIDALFGVQILHAIAIPVLAGLFLESDDGRLEWASLILIGLFPIWLSREHVGATIGPMLREHPLYQRVDPGTKTICAPHSLSVQAKTVRV